MLLQNKTILLTGGTSGIGYQLLRQLQPDNHLLVIARPSEKLNALVETFAGITVYSADLANPEEYCAVANQIIEHHPRIDILINNAAIQHAHCFQDKGFTYDSIAQEIHTNFTAPCSLVYLLLSTLLDTNRETAIVNINSGLALAPKTQSSVYCGSKAAIDGFSRSLCYQLAHTNIQVMQAFLPLVDTPMTQGRGAGKLSAEFVARKIIEGIEANRAINDIGKVKWLRRLLRIAPETTRKMMAKS